jgi:Na+/melibiose symporter-like transporter
MSAFLKPQQLPLWKKVMFALGQTGWALSSYGVAQLVIYFYIPPETGETVFKKFIDDKSIGYIFTSVGLIASSTYFLGCFLEPIVATWSEKATFAFGRRRTFLALACVPFAILGVLIFTPPIDGISNWNSVWLFFSILLLYFFMTLYVTPFNALINEISHSDEERMQIVMMISIGFAIGYGIGNSIFSLLPIAERYFSPHIAFRIILTGFSFIGLCCMLLPILCINEHTYCYKHPPNIISLKTMIAQVFSNKKFRVYAPVEMIYWTSNTMFMMGIPYFITLLFGYSKEYATLMILLTGLASFLTYSILGKLSAKIGNKKVMSIGFMLFALTFLYILLLRYIHVPMAINISLFVLINAFPLAIFGVVPMALTGEIANEDGRETGVYKNAAFFGMKSFMMKMGISIAQLLFPSLLIRGKSLENPDGVISIVIACLICTLIGWVFIKKYPE